MKYWLELYSVVFQNFSTAYPLSEKHLEVVFEIVEDALHRFPDNYDVIRQALSVYITIVSRFQKFFVKQGYSYFLRSIFEIYACNQSSSTITHGVEYTFMRFFALHGESFLLQAFQTLVGPVTKKGHESNAHALYKLLISLNKLALIGQKPKKPVSEKKTTEEERKTGEYERKTNEEERKPEEDKKPQGDKKQDKKSKDQKVSIVNYQGDHFPFPFCDRMEGGGLFNAIKFWLDKLSVAGISLPFETGKFLSFDAKYLVKFYLTVVGNEMDTQLSVKYLKLWRLMLPDILADYPDMDFMNQTVQVLVKDIFGSHLDDQS